MLDKEDIAVFEKAAELGIHRTVHAGEAGPAKMVLKVSVPSSKLFPTICLSTDLQLIQVSLNCLGQVAYTLTEFEVNCIIRMLLYTLIASLNQIKQLLV